MSQFRNYKKNTKQHLLYKKSHEYQTFDFVISKIKQYNKLNNLQMTMQEAFNLLNDFIDPSDPDINLPNSIHAYQTAEKIRIDHPNDFQLQLCGLIHDVGKILFRFNEPNWAVVGDTFPVGCKYQKSIIFYDSLRKNPDYNNPIYNTKYGVYSKHCGIQNLKLSFGHDEYLYMVLSNKNNYHHLSKKYINIIRFHSLYPWHTGKDYQYFMNNTDNQILKDVLNFNKYDLYSKDNNINISRETKKYYYNLLKEYFPQPLNW